MNRELDQVELVNPAGRAIGTANVAEAHRPPGLLHRAVSVLVIGPDGRLLLQRRAATKIRFAGYWANTCCGHPPPGTDPATFARQRLAEEMGLIGLDLVPVGAFRYQAADPGSGLAEHEYDQVFLGRINGEAPGFAPDPAEVGEWAWVPPQPLLEELQGGSQRDEGRYVPWLRQVLRVAEAI